MEKEEGKGRWPSIARGRVGELAARADEGKREKGTAHARKEEDGLCWAGSAHAREGGEIGLG